MESPDMSGCFPYNLSDGLMLESPQILLPWGSNTGPLERIGTPHAEVHDGLIYLTWNRTSVFDGIPVAVKYQSNLKDYFWLELNQETYPHSLAEASYSHALSELTDRLGMPHSSKIKSDGYPWTEWHYDDVCVSLMVCERFVEYLSFHVSKNA
jgi:hypothetical protein